MDVDVVASAGASAIFATIIFAIPSIKLQEQFFIIYFGENQGSFPKGYNMNEEVLLCKFAGLRWLLTLIGF